MSYQRLNEAGCVKTSGDARAISVKNFFGTAAAQLLHIAAMYTPGLRDVLQMQPVSFEEWADLLSLALPLFVLMEADKALRRPAPHRNAIPLAS